MKFELFLKSSIVKQLESGLIKLTEEGMYSIWVKTTCCALTSDQLRKAADVAEKYGRGYLLFTSRQIVTIPFIRLEDVERARSELEEISLKLDRCGSRVRNINVCWGQKVCPKAVLSPAALAGKLDSFFYDPLPHKIKLGISACSDDCVAGRFLADVHFIARQENGRKGWDAYLGGKLGLNAFRGEQVAELLSEDQAVHLTRNFFELMRAQAKKGDRSADLIRRIGLKRVREELNRNLEQPTEALATMDCTAQPKDEISQFPVLKIRATCGEVSSKQARAIAKLCDKYGRGMIYCGVRGSPEIPGVPREAVKNFERGLEKVGLKLITSPGHNLYACWGSDCTHFLIDTRPLIRRLETRLQKPDLSGLVVKIAGASCSNSCGLAYLSDLGIVAGKEPKVELGLCNGCGLCFQVCQRGAIIIKDGRAVIDYEKCRPCGQCLQVCPSSALVENRKGFLVFAGGQGEGSDPRLGGLLAEFLTEDQAFALVEKCLLMVKRRQTTVSRLVAEIGLEGLRAALSGPGSPQPSRAPKFWTDENYSCENRALGQTTSGKEDTSGRES